MPPARLAIWLKPAFCSSTSACAERAPERQTVTTGRSRDSSLVRAESWPSGISVAPWMCPSEPSNSSGSRTSTICTFGSVLFERARLDLPDAGEGEGQRRPAGIGRAAARSAVRAAAAQVGRHRDVDLLRMRQAQVVHVADEVGLADVAAQPRVEAALLVDAGDGQSAIVVGRIEQARRRQRQDLPCTERYIACGVALLEVGAAAAADQQAIAGEGHAFVIEHVGDAAMRVARRGAHFQLALAERTWSPCASKRSAPAAPLVADSSDVAAELALEQPRAGDVIGVDVGLERRDELQPQLLDQRRIAPRLLEHRVDQHRLRALPASPSR